MMSAAELIYAIVTGLALVAGFIIEWRRGGDFAGRLEALERQRLPDRVAEVEATLDRFRRSV